jgi:hypothetical protein
MQQPLMRAAAADDGRQMMPMAAHPPAPTPMAPIGNPPNLKSDSGGGSSTVQHRTPSAFVSIAGFVLNASVSAIVLSGLEADLARSRGGRPMMWEWGFVWALLAVFCLVWSVRMKWYETVVNVPLRTIDHSVAPSFLIFCYRTTDTVNFSDVQYLELRRHNIYSSTPQATVAASPDMPQMQNWRYDVCLHYIERTTRANKMMTLDMVTGYTSACLAQRQWEGFFVGHGVTLGQNQALAMMTAVAVTPNVTLGQPVVGTPAPYYAGPNPNYRSPPQAY